MAGLRLGYKVTSAQIQRRGKRASWKTSTGCVRAGMTSLEREMGRERAQAAVQRNSLDREQDFMHQAATRKLQVIPSWTNFVMFNSQHRYGRDRYVSENIILRLAVPSRPWTHSRVSSLGKPDEMTSFWQVWDKMGAAAR